MRQDIPFAIFTGAGASRAEPIKLPTMTEFFQKIMDNNRFPTTERITDKQYYKFILDSLYGGENNYDLERIMGALYGLKDFTNNDCWKIFQNPIIFDNIIKEILTKFGAVQTINGTLMNLIEMKPLISSATNKTYEKYKNDAEDLIFQLEWEIRSIYEDIPNQSIREVYEPLFELLIKAISSKTDSNIIPFFTTNYDMSVDWFFEPLLDQDYEYQNQWLKKFSKEVKFIDGFDYRGWSENEYDQMIEGDGKVYIPYYKLHGSLYWEKIAGRIKMGTNVANDPLNPRHLMIVYPSDKKELLDQPYYYNQKQLEYYLQRTNNLFIIGFSFRDPGIVKTFESALTYNKDLKIHVIGPEYNKKYLPEMDDFIKKNKDRVNFIKGLFGTAEVIDKMKDIISNTKSNLTNPV